MNQGKKRVIVPGCQIKDAGNSLKWYTDIARTGFKPIFNQDACIQCFICWFFCPDNAFVIENEKVIGINLNYCKGCGICVAECPKENGKSPLKMVAEDLVL